MSGNYTRWILCLAAVSGLIGCSDSVERTCISKDDCLEFEKCDILQNKCVADECLNGVKDGDETDVDCGGHCVGCESGRQCQTDKDCAGKSCENGVCTNPESQCTSAKSGDLVITEVYNNIKTGQLFDNSNSKQTEFIEIVNISGKSVGISNLRIECLRTDDQKGTKIAIDISKNACLESNHALVISNTEIKGMPEEAQNLVSIEKDGYLINTAEYECALFASDGENSMTVHSVKIGKPGAGISDALAELVSTNHALVPHNTLGSLNYSPGRCANGARYINQCKSTCHNGVLDEDETDVDCGGAQCDKCEGSKTCKTADDCISGECGKDFKCTDKSCVETGCSGDALCDPQSGKCHTCDDGLTNGDETDTDCGGVSCGACDRDKSCKLDSDCKTLECSNGICTGSEVICETPNKGDLKIAEIFNSIDAKAPMSVIEPDDENVESAQKQTEFIEIYNTTDHALLLDNLSLTTARQNNGSTTEKPKQFALRGCINAHQAAVISGQVIQGLPKGVLNIVSMAESNALTNTAIYQYELVNAEGDVLHSVIESEVPKSKISRVIDLTSSREAPEKLVNHTDINKALNHSPGYCTNGALYIDECKDSCDNGIYDTGESDIDCGGVCETKCKAGQSCVYDSDCITNDCQESVCSDEAAEEPKPDELVINEVHGAESKSDVFDIQKTPQCEFIEVVNLSSNKRSLGQSTLRMTRGDTQNSVELKLSGSIPAKGVLVIHNCEANMALPKDAVAIKNPKAITNGKDYTFEIFNSTELIAKAEVAIPASASKISQNRAVDADPSAEFVKHNTVQSNSRKQYQNSPGYCANGGLFSEDCHVEDTCTNNKVDSDETDMDCGGSCTPCDKGKSCKIHADCTTQYCEPVSLKCEVFACTSDEDCKAQDKNMTCFESACISCSDNVKNGDETDVDCGGSCKTKCDDGLNCNDNSDCTNGICDNNICISCSDGKLNGDETDKDCGGSCGATCAEGNKCISDADCIIGTGCLSNRCQADGCTEAAAGNLVISEVLNNTTATSPMTMYGKPESEQKQAEYVEIVNLTDKKVRLAGLSLNAQRQGETTEKQKTFALSGCIEPNNAAIISAEHIVDLPEGVYNITGLATNYFTNTGYYAYWLADAKSGAEICRSTETAVPASKGMSTVIEPVLYSAEGSSMVEHITINESLNHSPGYCTNGSLYVNICKPSCEDGTKNGSETDTDCGGSCKTKCADGKKCSINTDCKNNQCISGVCSNVIPFDLKKNELIVNEVMGSPKAGEKFVTYPNTNQCEFIEIVSTVNAERMLNGIALKYEKTDGTVAKTVELTGSLQPYGAIVLAECSIDDADKSLIPDGVTFQTINKNSITNGSDYYFYLTDNTNETPKAKRQKLSTGNGKSQNRSPDRTSTNADLVFHDTVNPALIHSPGYCANGKSFKNNCI